MQKKLKIKKGDTVKVIAGAANGQQGVILDVDYRKERVFVEGLSIVNKKQKGFHSIVKNKMHLSKHLQKNDGSRYSL